jgi:glycosyltransferase involved in cell wall biosynthesis
MAPRRVLILNYHFPPVGGAGALRGVTLVRRLPALGYEPVVVTGPGASFGRWSPQDDTLRELIGDVEVHRIATPEPPRGGDALGDRLDRVTGRPPRWERWLEEGFVEVGRRVAGVDLVYADLGPDATAHAGARLARELGVPLVADLGDPWALDEMRVYPTALHRRRDRARMRRALTACDAVVMNTAEAAGAVRDAFAPLRSRPVLALPVGYDADDFRGPEPVRDDGAFRIVHTGSFHTALGESLRASSRRRALLGGGADQPVEVLTRSPLYLRRALDRVLAEHPHLAGRIELHLAGPLTDADRRAVDGLPGVRLLGYCTHDATIALIRSADLLFLPMQDLPAGHRARMVPCKGYEYLASGRPILAAMPDGDGREIFTRAAGATVVRPDDVGAMAAAIAAEASRGERRPSATAERAWLLAGLERGHLNRELARAFDRVLAGRATTTTSAGEPALTGSTA